MPPAFARRAAAGRRKWQTLPVRQTLPAARLQSVGRERGPTHAPCAGLPKNPKNMPRRVLRPAAAGPRSSRALPFAAARSCVPEGVGLHCDSFIPPPPRRLRNFARTGAAAGSSPASSGRAPSSPSRRSAAPQQPRGPTRLLRLPRELWEQKPAGTESWHHCSRRRRS